MVGEQLVDAFVDPLPTEPCAGSRTASGRDRISSREARKSANGLGGGTGSNPIDGVIRGST